MRKVLRYSCAAAASGLFTASMLSILSMKNWDLRDKENQVALATGSAMTALIWAATLL